MAPWEIYTIIALVTITVGAILMIILNILQGKYFDDSAFLLKQVISFENTYNICADETKIYFINNIDDCYIADLKEHINKNRTFWQKILSFHLAGTYKLKIRLTVLYKLGHIKINDHGLIYVTPSGAKYIEDFETNKKMKSPTILIGILSAAISAIITVGIGSCIS